ncbi:hypothetical protein Holit_00096 [Hollandina sp. SP2]
MIKYLWIMVNKERTLYRVKANFPSIPQHTLRERLPYDTDSPEKTLVFFLDNFDLNTIVLIWFILGRDGYFENTVFIEGFHFFLSIFI